MCLFCQLETIYDNLDLRVDILMFGKIAKISSSFSRVFFLAYEILISQ